MDSIAFPHLHITFSNVAKSIDVFGFSIAYYGIIIACGMVLAFFFIQYESKRLSLSPDAFVDVFFVAIICGIIGARIYYVVFAWDLYKDDLISIINIREGGLAIYGGVIGGAIGVIVMTKIKKIRTLLAGDVVMPGVLIGQICGRWGNFFNREAFGGYTDNVFAMRLPLEAVRSGGDITEEMRLHETVIDGITYVQVHPTFLYESCLNVCVLIFLLVYRRHKKWTGEIVCLYLIGYGAVRFFVERLRTDQLKIMHTDLPVSLCLSACIFTVGVLWWLFMRYKGRQVKNADADTHLGL